MPPINVNPQNPIGFLTPFGPREINEVPLDVVVRESINHHAVVTQHPIEVASGSGVLRGTISDNAYLEPIIYTMRGAVSDLPISWRLFDNRYANASAETRSLSAYQLLLKHFRELAPFTLKTPFGDLDNMLFRSFRIPRDQTTKHAILFNAEMIELQVVVPKAISGKRTEDQVSGEQAQNQAIEEKVFGPTSPIPVGGS